MLGGTATLIVLRGSIPNPLKECVKLVMGTALLAMAGMPKTVPVAITNSCF